MATIQGQRKAHNGEEDTAAACRDDTLAAADPRKPGMEMAENVTITTEYKKIMSDGGDESNVRKEGDKKMTKETSSLKIRSSSLVNDEDNPPLDVKGNPKSEKKRKSHSSSYVRDCCC